MLLSIRNLTFNYEGAYEPVFSDVSVNLDTSWRLGLVGRNGRGKTTLLKLLMGEHEYRGQIDMPLPAAYFPYEVPSADMPTREALLSTAPDVPEWRLVRELALLNVADDALERPLRTLSKGEQTKALLAALFARDDAYPLIDEPTNHLDLHGRELVADYLRGKDGFLLVSHDRAFLNRCIDHVMSINRADISVIQGDFDTWEEQFDRRNDYERSRNEDLKRDIKRLEQSARRAAEWSNRVERGKYHVAESDVAAVDKGYIGARSASMMKRSLNTVKRRERELEEKSKLMHNVETVGELKLTVLKHPKKTLVSVRDGYVSYDGRVICEGIGFELRQGERAALVGDNGAGKSSVLKTICGLSDALGGEVRTASGVTISYVPQETDGLAGKMRDFISENGLDETLFKAILRNMDFGREQFDKDLRELSQGQRKKLLLAKSLCTPAHLYIWDEPLNYIDVLSRMQVERLISEYQPTILLVEHDGVFIDRVCNREPIRLTRKR